MQHTQLKPLPSISTSSLLLCLLLATEDNTFLNLVDIVLMNIVVLPLQVNVSTNNLWPRQCHDYLLAFIIRGEKRVICHFQKAQIHLNLCSFQPDFALILFMVCFALFFQVIFLPSFISSLLKSCADFARNGSLDPAPMIWPF